MSTTNSVNDTKDMAKDHAQQAVQGAQVRTSEVAEHAKDAAQDVVATAAGQAGDIKDETVRQARNLLSEASVQVSSQAAEQARRLTGLLRELGDELKAMASAGHGGSASELAHQASERAHQAAGYLDGRQPSDLLDDLRGFARRRPGGFLAGAALLGMAAGRLGRGIKDSGGTDSSRAANDPRVNSSLAAGPQAIDLADDENMGLSSNSGLPQVNEALAVPGDEPLYVPRSVGVQP